MTAKSPDTGIDYGLTGHPELVSKLKKGQIETEVILTEDLPFYLKAASATGFKVKEIAGPGGEFPSLVEIGGSVAGMVPETKVFQERVPDNGRIAVSIERPKNRGSEDYENFSPFRTCLNYKMRERAQSPLKSTTKP